MKLKLNLGFLKLAARRLRLRLRLIERFSIEKGQGSWVYRYGLTLLVCSLFLVIRLSLGHWIDGAPFILLVVAVLVCALFGGIGAGLLATLITSAMQVYFFSTPYLSVSLSKLSGLETVGILTYIVMALLLNLLLWDRRGVRSDMYDTEQQFRAAFDQAAVGMTYSDLKGRWIEVNSKYADMIGYSLDELRTKSFREITHPDDIESSEAVMSDLMAGKSDHLTLSKRYIKKDKSIFWAEMTISIVRDAHKTPKYFVAVIEDVTAKKEAQEKLLTSEKLYRTIIETAEEGVWILDSVDKTRFVNNKMAEMMGYSVTELVGRSPGDFVGDEATVVLKRHLELRHQGISEQYDLKWRRKDGSELWTSISTTPILDADGQYGGALAMISDISKRKQFESQIEYENQRIYGLFDAAPAMIALLRGPDHIFEYANQIYMDNVAINRNILNMPLREALPELEGQGFYELLDGVFTTGKPFIGLEQAFQVDRGDGVAEEHFYNFVAQASKSQDDQIDGVFIHAQEVTEQVRARQKLIERNQEASLGAAVGIALAGQNTLDAKLQLCSQAMVDNLEAAFARIWVVDESGDTLELRASAGLYTHLNGAHSRVKIGELKIGRIAQQRQAHLTNAVVGDAAVNNQEWAKSEGMVAFAGYPLIFNDRLVGVMAMFSRQKLPKSTLAALATVADEIALGINQAQIEAVSRTTQERLELSQEAGNIGTFEWNIVTNQVIWSSRLEDLYGMEEGEFGGHFEDWMRVISAEDRAEVRKEIAHAVADRADVDNEFRINLPDGAMRWIAMRGRLYYDANKQPVRMIGINRNVTKRKLAERDLRFLTKASSVLASSLNYESTLGNVAALAVEELADWCTIDILDDNGDIDRIAQTTSNRIGDESELLTGSHFKPYSEAESGVPLVLRTGQPVYCRNLTDGDLKILSQSPEQLEVIKQIGFSSVIIVPIQILGWAAGAISLSLIGPNRQYSESDVALAESLAERASAAIDNAWLYKETQAAREDLEYRVKRRTQELTSKNDELNEAQRIAHLGSWEWDISSDVRGWSAELYRIYGLNQVDFRPTTESIIRYSHPDDRERVSTEERLALSHKDGLLATEFRIVRADGEERNLFGQGRVLKDETGKPVKMVGTVLDITDRKKVEQMKSDFVSLVSHQLKTPLAIIKGYTDNILMGIAGDLSDKQRQYLLEMQAITSKYYYLIADLLNVSRIERGVISTDIKPADLIEITNTALSHYADRIKTKGLKLVVDFPGQPLFVQADQAKAVEAIGNVIDNAIKFTDFGRIAIKVSGDGNCGVVLVSDSGRGMDSETVGKLFRKDQVFSGSPSPEGGSGLGLYIAKEFFRIQKGDISVVSMPNQGSKFTFKLPLAKVELGVSLHGH